MDITIDVNAYVARKVVKSGRRPFGLDKPRAQHAQRVPYGGIRWLVDREHVSMPYVDIGTAIVNRLKHTNATRHELLEAVRFACAAHLENRILYRFVMRGGV